MKSFRAIVQLKESNGLKL